MPLCAPTKARFKSRRGLFHGRRFHLNVEHRVNCLGHRKVCECPSKMLFGPGEEGQQKLDRLMAWIRAQGCDAISSEFTFLHGRIDLLLSHRVSGHYQVVEVKTGYRSLLGSTKADALQQKEMHVLQAVAGAVLLEETLPEMVCSKAWVYYTTGPVIVEIAKAQFPSFANGVRRLREATLKKRNKRRKKKKVAAVEEAPSSSRK